MSGIPFHSNAAQFPPFHLIWSVAWDTSEPVYFSFWHRFLLLLIFHLLPTVVVSLHCTLYCNSLLPTQVVGTESFSHPVYFVAPRMKIRQNNCFVNWVWHGGVAYSSEAIRAYVAAMESYALWRWSKNVNKPGRLLLSNDPWLRLAVVFGPKPSPDSWSRLISPARYPACSTTPWTPSRQLS